MLLRERERGSLEKIRAPGDEARREERERGIERGRGGGREDILSSRLLFLLSSSLELVGVEVDDIDMSPSLSLSSSLDVLLISR